MKVEVFVSAATDPSACTKDYARLAFVGRLGGADVVADGTIRDFTVTRFPSTSRRRQLQASFGTMEFFVYASWLELGYPNAQSWIETVSSTLSTSAAGISYSWGAACGCVISVVSVSATAAVVRRPSPQPTLLQGPTSEESNAALLLVGILVGIVGLLGLAACAYMYRRNGQNAPRVGARVLVTTPSSGRLLMSVQEFDKSTGVVVLAPPPGSQAAELNISLDEYRSIVVRTNEAAAASPGGKPQAPGATATPLDQLEAGVELTAATSSSGGQAAKMDPPGTDGAPRSGTSLDLDLDGGCMDFLQGVGLSAKRAARLSLKFKEKGYESPSDFSIDDAELSEAALRSELGMLSSEIRKFRAAVSSLGEKKIGASAMAGADREFGTTI